MIPGALAFYPDYPPKEIFYSVSSFVRSFRFPLQRAGITGFPVPYMLSNSFSQNRRMV